jgi:predicted ATPase/DNA-binding CsgD family transcriptional regulator
MSSAIPRPQLVTPDAEARPSFDSGLPAALTPLIGRQRELPAIATLLGSGARLLTLTGPGGVGKTRLALEVAHECSSGYADGAAFVPLAPIHDAGLVATTIAQTLEVEETGVKPVIELLKAWLRPRQLLLVVDNFEQVMEAAPLLIELLTACPHLTILVTSRSILHLSGEHDFPVPPLAVPGDGREEIAQSGAVQLFVARARAVRPDFALTDSNAATVAAICRQLDGLPLAIELAAARLRALSPQSLLARLTNRLEMLTGGPRDVPDRLRTMRDAIAWSYDLLPPEAQTGFRWLAVFVGGFTLDAVEAVSRRVEKSGSREASDTRHPTPDTYPSPITLVTTLLEASLLRRVDVPGDGTERFGMLEMIAEYGLEQLVAAGEEATARNAHAEAFLALAEAAEPELLGDEQLAWFTRLETERSNLRAALGWLCDRGHTERALRLAGALGLFWTWPPYIQEGRQWLDTVLALSDVEAYPAPLAKALNAAGILAEWQADYRRAWELLSQARALRETLGDRLGVAEVLGSLGNVALGQGEFGRAEQMLVEGLALFRELGHAFWEAETLSSLGTVAAARGDHRRAVDFYEQSAASWRQQSGPVKTSDALIPLGWSAFLLGDQARARAAYAEALALEIVAEDDLRIGRCVRGAAALVGAAGDPALAAQLFAVDAAVRDEVGVPLRAAAAEQLAGVVSGVREALGAAAFAAAWEAGRTLPLAEAAAIAATVFAGPGTTATGGPEDSWLRTRLAPDLTTRECDVLRLLLAGRTDKEIAAALFISRRTASNHVTAIRAKLGVRSRAAVVATVRERLAAPSVGTRR